MSEREATGSPSRCQSGEQAGARASADDWARQALAAAPDGLVVFDAAGSVRLANEAATVLLGPDVVAGAHLETALASAPSLRSLVRGGPAADPDPGSWATLAGPGETQLLARVVPLGDGACVLVVRAPVDEVRAERDLWQAEKMAALGRLASSVAHEVRNPLGAVDIQLQLLAEDARRRDDPEAERIVQRVDRARTEIRRLDGIVQNFLRFSRPPTVHLEPTDPRLLVQRMHDLVAPEARARGIELQLAQPDTLPWVRADENVLSQALLNVLLNAFQAVDEADFEAGGGARVGLRCRGDERTGRVLVEVSDNGCGIPAHDLERVLEYYYTTKDTGTGLGLSIAQGILQQHGGSLHLTSRIGAGTTVALQLPTCSPTPP